MLCYGGSVEGRPNLIASRDKQGLLVTYFYPGTQRTKQITKKTQILSMLREICDYTSRTIMGKPWHSQEKVLKIIFTSSCLLPAPLHRISWLIAFRDSNPGRLWIYDIQISMIQSETMFFKAILNGGHHLVSTIDFKKRPLIGQSHRLLQL